MTKGHLRDSPWVLEVPVDSQVSTKGPGLCEAVLIGSEAQGNEKQETRLQTQLCPQ